MDRTAIRNRARDLYTDEIHYALSREEGSFDVEPLRERAAMRLAREFDGIEKEVLFEMCRANVDNVGKSVERSITVDLSSGQLLFGGVIVTGDRQLCPIEKARYRDWFAFDEIREESFRRHAAKREREREVVAEIMERLQTHGEDATTIAVCADLFTTGERAA